MRAISNVMVIYCVGPFMIITYIVWVGCEWWAWVRINVVGYVWFIIFVVFFV